MRFFIDSNIIISAVLWKGNEERLMDAGRRGLIVAVSSDYVLDETARVLVSKFGFDRGKVLELMEYVIGCFVEIVHADDAEVHKAERLLRDKRDAAVLAAALKSSSILVTGDKRLAEDAKGVIKVMSAGQVIEKESLL